MKKLSGFLTILVNFRVLHDPDSIKTGTRGRPPEVDVGILTGVERAGRFTIAEPISTESISIDVKELLC